MKSRFAISMSQGRTRTRSWMAAGFVSVSVMLHGAGGASANFAGRDASCDISAAKVTKPGFDDSYFKRVTKIWASAEGLTGVFFLQGPGGVDDTVVLKFELQRNVGAVVSRRMLDSLGVPSDTLIDEISDSKKIQKVFDGIVTASARQGVVDDDRKDKFSALLDKLSPRFDKKNKKSYGPPTQIIVTRFLTAAESASSLGAALQSPQGSSKFTAEKKARNVRQFLAAVKALGSEHNQRFLGYLYMMDILMGNNDRFLRTPSNWNNVFLAQGSTPGSMCLEAIDNEAHAPLASYLAMARYISDVHEVVPSKTDSKTKKVLQLKEFGKTIRFQTAADADSAGKPITFATNDLTKKWIAEVAAAYETQNIPIDNTNALEPGFDDANNKVTFDGDKQAIAGVDYLAALMGTYKDDIASLNPNHFGPSSALAGAPIEIPILKGWDPLKTPPAHDTCEQVSEIPAQGSPPIWVRRQLRTELAFMITSLFVGSIADMIKGGNTTLALVESDFDGNPVFTKKFSDSFHVCTTKLTVSGDAESVAGKKIEIDWKEFDKNFQLGLEMALRDISNIDAFKPLITAANKNMPNLKTTDVHVTAMTARAQFIADYASGIPLDQIIPGMLRNRKKEFYTKDASVPADKYLFTTNSQGVFIWVPQ